MALCAGSSLLRCINLIYCLNLPCHSFNSPVSLLFSILKMVRMSVLADALKTIYNAEKRGKRQVVIRPSSKVIIKFLQAMQVHGK